jgi:hypothetical protein
MPSELCGCFLSAKTQLFLGNQSLHGGLAQWPRYLALNVNIVSGSNPLNRVPWDRGSFTLVRFDVVLSMICCASLRLANADSSVSKQRMLVSVAFKLSCLGLKLLLDDLEMTSA